MSLNSNSADVGSEKTNILEDQLILICHLAVLKFHIYRFSERV